MTFPDSVTSVLARVLASSLASTAFLMVVSAPVISPGVALAQVVTAPNGATRNPPPRANDDARITLNFKDADLGQIAEAVAMATPKTFIIDPRVRARVTMLS